MKTEAEYIEFIVAYLTQHLQTLKKHGYNTKYLNPNKWFFDHDIIPGEDFESQDVIHVMIPNECKFNEDGTNSINTSDIVTGKNFCDDINGTLFIDVVEDKTGNLFINYIFED